MIRVDGDTAHVTTASEALEVCNFPGVEHVVVEDRAEAIKLQKMIRSMR